MGEVAGGREEGGEKGEGTHGRMATLKASHNRLWKLGDQAENQ